jgi:hypothetical protein
MNKEQNLNNADNQQLNIAGVRRSFWCKLGFHSLKYTNRYRVTSKVKCSKCGQEYIEGMAGELVRC